MSQSRVSREVGISQAALSKFEKGVLEPSEETLCQLAEYFHFPPEWFRGDDGDIPSGLVFHRKRAALTATIRTRLEAEAKLRLIDVAKMLKPEERISNVVKHENRSPADAARALRKHWGLATGKPVDNLVSLLERNSILVLPFDFGTDKIDGFFLSLGFDFFCIALNDSSVFTPDRRRFTLAHELGHAILHRESFPDPEVEKEADEFAAELLAPAASIRKDFSIPITLKSLAQLKSKWKISMAAVLYRARTLDVIDDKTWRRLCIYLSTLGYRKREPLCGLSPERPELLTQIIEDTKKRIGTTPIWQYLQLEEDVFHQRYGGITAQEEMT
ncbi:MAG: ImmA/IrrE family metallo-endopeptidase [Thermoguttaceae bacterium]|nr:ImmA/IrrE family metallo-endopeptidase [Thermoguttaceae bacterium]